MPKQKAEKDQVEQVDSQDTPDVEYAWDESVSAEAPQKVTVTEVTPEHPKDPEEEMRQQIISLQQKIRDMKAKFRKEYAPHIDIVSIFCNGIKGPRAYIVRSMDLNDSEQLNTEVEEQVESFLEQLKADFKKRGIDPAKAGMTVGDRDRILERTMVSTFTLYPENMRDIIDSGAIKPGDFAECYKAITSLSGYFPPLIDAEEIDISGTDVKGIFNADTDINPDENPDDRGV